MPSREAWAFFMAYLRGGAREQGTTFPATQDEVIPADHLRLISFPFPASAPENESQRTNTPTRTLNV